MAATLSLFPAAGTDAAAVAVAGRRDGHSDRNARRLRRRRRQRGRRDRPDRALSRFAQPAKARKPGLTWRVASPASDFEPIPGSCGRRTSGSSGVRRYGTCRRGRTRGVLWRNVCEARRSPRSVTRAPCLMLAPVRIAPSRWRAPPGRPPTCPKPHRSSATREGRLKSPPGSSETSSRLEQMGRKPHRPATGRRARRAAGTPAGLSRREMGEEV